nr:hypothetical protein [Bryobacter sp.]
DVMFRKLRWNGRIAMDAPVTAAGSDKFEARASIAFDPRNRLWVAYEGSETKWGKDFGAYETTGVALYQGHSVKVKVFEGAKALVTGDSLAEALPGPPAALAQRRRRAQAAAAAGPTLPNPELAKRRAPSGTPQPGPNLKNSFPRIAVDGQGMVYLALRTVTGVRTPVGSVWQQTVLSFDGEKWSDVIPVPNTDGLLDLRPALLPVENGRLLMAAISDHRQTFTPGAGAGRRSDSVNSDIYAAEFDFAGLRKNADKLTAAPAESGALSAENKAEIEMVGRMRAERVAAAGAKVQLLRGEFHRHTEISGDGGGDGPIIDAYRYMIDAAYMDWGGCCDHDNGGGREYFWWISQKLTDAYNLGPHFVNMFSYERSVRYPEGHRNTVFAQRGIRPLPRLPKVADDAPFAPAPDTQMLYRYLRQFQGIVASHTSGTDMGTDWRDNDPLVEPVVEIYQGDRQNYEMPGAPRSNNEKDSIGGWRPLGFVSNALQKGYRLGFQASSDHVSTHMSYCNLWVKEPTREGVMEAFRARRVYGATDNILADVRCGEHFMGEEFTLLEPPAISVRLLGMAPFSKVLIVKNGAVVYSAEPNTKEVKFTWRDAAPEKGKTSYYYVRGEQQDGELVWVSPMWITVK